MAKLLHNGMEVIDSRDVIARIQELENYRDEAKENGDAELLTAEDSTEFRASDDFGEDEYNELKQLQAMSEDASRTPDWIHGKTLIQDGYFEEYARQLAEDIGTISGKESWPCDCIDWERAADALKMDYFSVEFGDVTYWVRS